MSVGFYATVNNGEVVIPRTVVVAHWWSMPNPIEVVFPKDIKKQITWKRPTNDKNDVRLNIGGLFSSLKNGDKLQFSYQHETPTLFRVVSICNDLSIQIVDLNKKRTCNQYMHQIPTEFKDFIDDIFEVQGDGNCGYRAIARLIGNNKSYETVRQDLIDELNSDRDGYDQIFNVVEEMKEKLSNPTEWMNTEMGPIISTKYKVPLVCLNLKGSTTYAPLRHAPSETSSLICIAHVNNNHFVPVILKENSPIPEVYRQWLDKSIYNDWLIWIKERATFARDEDPRDNLEDHAETFARENKDTTLDKQVSQEHVESKDVAASDENAYEEHAEIDGQRNSPQLEDAADEFPHQEQAEFDGQGNLAPLVNEGNDIVRLRPQVNEGNDVVRPQVNEGNDVVRPHVNEGNNIMRPHRQKMSPQRFKDFYMLNPGAQYETRKAKKNKKKNVKVAVAEGEHSKKNEKRTTKIERTLDHLTHESTDDEHETRKAKKNKKENAKVAAADGEHSKNNEKRTAESERTSERETHESTDDERETRKAKKNKKENAKVTVADGEHSQRTVASERPPERETHEVKNRKENAKVAAADGEYSKYNEKRTVQSERTSERETHESTDDEGETRKAKTFKADELANKKTAIKKVITGLCKTFKIEEETNEMKARKAIRILKFID